MATLNETGTRITTTQEPVTGEPALDQIVIRQGYPSDPSRPLSSVEFRYLALAQDGKADPSVSYPVRVLRDNPEDPNPLWQAAGSSAIGMIFYGTDKQYTQLNDDGTTTPVDNPVFPWCRGLGIAGLCLADAGKVLIRSLIQHQADLEAAAEKAAAEAAQALAAADAARQAALQAGSLPAV